MRKTFSSIIEKIAAKDEKIIFITGDLGYNALENVKHAIGDRFINAGVAEQNMVGLAAGMAHKGYKVFCYSIAPFIVYRCLEQFRNDVCFHKLPVFLVGNGGGYGYGIMGSSHHAIEDLACLGSLPNVNCYIPAFNDDIEPMINKMLIEKKPAYFRLGLGKANLFTQKNIGTYNQQVTLDNAAGTIIALGPVIHNVMAALKQEGLENKFNLFSCISSPLDLPEALEKEISKTGKLIVVEEHVSIGGIGQQISAKLLEKNIQLKKFITLHAKGYLSGTYGDQGFHQKESHLDTDSIVAALRKIISD